MLLLFSYTTLFFFFFRYISNIIIGYELFKKGNKETARIVLLSIGKWLNKLDESKNDEFYLSISDGLKHVLITTFIRMSSSNFNRKNQWVSSIDSDVKFFIVINDTATFYDGSPSQTKRRRSVRNTLYVLHFFNGTSKQYLGRYIFFMNLKF